MNKTPLEEITGLLVHGDAVSIQNGKLVIATHDGRQVPSGWLEKSALPVITAICELKKVTAYRYCSYSTGCYGRAHAGGLTLQLRDLSTGESAYVIFNVDVRYSRNTKYHRCGKRMPQGQFRAHKEGQFCRLWQSAGMALPQRLGTFHDRMGKLSECIYTGEGTRLERLNAQTFKPLSVTENELRTLLTVPKSDRTNFVQEPDNHRTTIVQVDRTSFPLKPPASKAICAIQATGEVCRGKKVKREHGYKGPTPPLSNSVTNQTKDEWLSDYDKAS